MMFMIICLFVAIVATFVSFVDFRIGNKISGWFSAIIAALNFAAFLNLAVHI